METDTNKVHYLTMDECAALSKDLTDKQTTDNDFMIDLTFKKDGHGWYADVPTHTRAQNSMVAGADKVCETMSGGCPSFTVRFRTVQSNGRAPIVTLRRIVHRHGYGAEYIAFGMGVPFPAYLCDVTHDVMGEHAKRIFVYEIKKSA